MAQSRIKRNALNTTDLDFINKVVVTDALGRLPAVDGSLLTGIDSGVGSPLGGTPGGVDTQVQFNDNGNFGGSSNLTWDGTKLTIVADGSPATLALDITGDVEVDGQIRASSTLTTANSPGYAFVSDTISGFFNKAPGEIGVAQDGYQRFGFEGNTGSPETSEVGEFRCYEAPDNGSAYLGVKAPTSVANSLVYTLPELPTGSPLAGHFLTTDEDGVLSWEVPTGQVERYDIVAQAFGTINDATLFGMVVAVEPFTIQGSFGSPTVHDGYAVTAPTSGSPAGSPATAGATITVTHNGSSIGTLVFDNGSQSLSLATITETVVAVGDRIQFTLTTGNGIEDFSVTLAATLS